MTQDRARGQSPWPGARSLFAGRRRPAARREFPSHSRWTFTIFASSGLRHHRTFVPRSMSVRPVAIPPSGWSTGDRAGEPAGRHGPVASKRGRMKRVDRCRRQARGCRRAGNRRPRSQPSPWPGARIRDGSVVMDNLTAEGSPPILGRQDDHSLVQGLSPSGVCAARDARPDRQGSSVRTLVGNRGFHAVPGRLRRVKRIRRTSLRGSPAVRARRRREHTCREQPRGPWERSPPRRPSSAAPPTAQR